MDTCVYVYGGDDATNPGRYLSGWGEDGRARQQDGREKELQSKQITSIVAGNNHMAAVSGAWKLYTWGENSTGQLGLDLHYVETHFVTTPTLVTNNMLDLHPIKMVAFGKYHSACVTDEGVVTWGKTELLGQPLLKPNKNNSNMLFLESTTASVPQLISMTEPVVHIACGTGHTTLITENGDLYSFGTGNMGQLGHGDVSDRSQPTLVEFFKKLNKSVQYADCGGFHTVCVTSDGRAYAFGLSTYGQTGQGANAESMTLAPKLITMPTGVQLSSVACGESHTLLLSTQGQVFACGYGIYGQCGQGTRRDQHIPMAIKIESQAPVVSISCGANHSAAVTATGQLFVWGSGEHHQLSLTATKDQLSPVQVPFSDPVRSVSCGDKFTVILTGGPSKSLTSTIHTDLLSILLVQEFSDISFAVRDNVSFPAHKVVVFNRCPALRKTFGDVSEMKFAELSKEAIRKILEFLYTDYTYVEESSPLAAELLAFSAKYDLPKLANLCGDLTQPSLSNFISEMTMALQNIPEFHDVTFSVEDKTVHANKAILAARCKFFRAMFTSGYQESNASIVNIDDCSYEAFSTFLEWCYTDRINTSPKHATESEEEKKSEGEEGSALLPEMLVLADKYGAFSLFRMVEGKLLEGVEISNIVSIMQFAETYNANYLSEFCLNFIAKEYEKVMARGGGLEISEAMMEKVKERRAVLLGESREEQHRLAMEARMKLYEIERKERAERPATNSMDQMARVLKESLANRKPNHYTQ